MTKGSTLKHGGIIGIFNGAEVHENDSLKHESISTLNKYSNASNM